MCNRLNATQSLYLDFLRASSAVIVLFHHYNLFISPRNPAASPDFGQEAVMIFFVLSGFIISYVTATKETSLQEYASKRISRFFPVLIPAVILHVLFYYFNVAKDPGAYSLIECGDARHLPEKVFAALSFSNFNAFTTHKLFLPGGGPFWSITCEWWYYVAYGLFFYTPNRYAAYIVLIFLAAVLGPPVLLLFPVWLIGNIAHLLWRNNRIGSRAALVLATITPPVLFLVWISNVRHTTLNTAAILGKYFPPHATYFPYFWLIGILIGLHVCGMMKLLESHRFTGLTKVSRFIKPLVNCSFFLYLLHLPMMITLKTHMPEGPWRALIPYLTLGICVIVGPPVENLRYSAHQIVRAWINKLSTIVLNSTFGSIFKLEMKQP